MKRSFVQSAYFCPNERINLTTSSSLSYQFVELPDNNSTGFDFLVKGKFLKIFLLVFFRVY